MTDADFKWHYREVARHRNEAIEECARVADSFAKAMKPHIIAVDIAAAIRGLKNK